MVFLIETNDGYRFGVFISIFLGGDFGDKNFYLRDDNAFIFSFNTFKKYEIKKSYEDYAVYYRKNKFPWFGKRDIYLRDNYRGDIYSLVKYDYDEDEGGDLAVFISKDSSTLGGGDNYTVKVVELGYTDEEIALFKTKGVL